MHPAVLMAISDFEIDGLLSVRHSDKNADQHPYLRVQLFLVFSVGVVLRYIQILNKYLVLVFLYLK